MKKHVLKIVVVLMAFGCSTEISELNRSWLSDFESLKTGLTSGYANLKMASEKEQLDLRELNKSTIDNLKKAKTKKEAQDIISNFLKKFNDGHLRAKIIEPERTTETRSVNENTNVLNTDDGPTALEKMGFEKVATKYDIKYDSMENYTALLPLDNPFEAGIVNNPEGKIGIIKIGFFGYWRFWTTALRVWEAYRKEIDGECDGSCQWNFIKEVENELSALLISRIGQLKAENIAALAVDVSGNGGGTEWYEAVARFFSSEPHLIGSKMYFVKHDHWAKAIQKDIDRIDEDLANPEIRDPLKQKLIQLKAAANRLKELCKNECSASEVWEGQNTNCLALVNHSYQSSFPSDIIDDPQFKELNAQYLIGTSRFLPYRTGVYTGPLYVVQDKRSGSATEGFSSLLQLNNLAEIVGENSYGAGCGYTNGGIKIKLENIGLIISMPDCVRLREDGENEIYGIKPDIPVQWNEEDDMFTKGRLVIKSIEEHLFR